MILHLHVHDWFIFFVDQCASCGKKHEHNTAAGSHSIFQAGWLPNRALDPRTWIQGLARDPRPWIQGPGSKALLGIQGPGSKAFDPTALDPGPGSKALDPSNDAFSRKVNVRF